MYFRSLIIWDVTVFPSVAEIREKVTYASSVEREWDSRTMSGMRSLTRGLSVSNSTGRKHEDALADACRAFLKPLIPDSEEVRNPTESTWKNG